MYLLEVLRSCQDWFHGSLKFPRLGEGEVGVSCRHLSPRGEEEPCWA